MTLNLTMKLRHIFSALLIASAPIAADACTSAIISAKASENGRPIIWKHRDTSAKNNFLYRVEKPGEIGYVALFNGATELKLDEAWMGMNDAGFAIINTVAYNLPANDPAWTDREGYVMAQALATCRTVDDFEKLLNELPKPLGVRTNFGVLDANGNGAYFETDDYKYVRFNLSDTENGVLIRTNYAYSGTPDAGKGYIRHSNVEALLATEIEYSTITPASLTEGLGRSFYNAVLDYDAYEADDSWTVDQDFIARKSSTASIAIEGLLPGEDPSKMMMWANVGYPPCSHVVPVTLTEIPEEVGPNSPKGAYSILGLEAAEWMRQIYPIARGNGNKYINLDILREICDDEYNKSLEQYYLGAKKRDGKL